MELFYKDGEEGDLTNTRFVVYSIYMSNEEVVEFEWDEGNSGKNQKHEVSDQEAEEPFFSERKFIFKDILHSGNEERFRLIGKTKKGRLLLVVFTYRKKKVRIISARDTNKKEEILYEKAN